jgi:glycosyltransferase involved in cell wall biosynthesis
MDIMELLVREGETSARRKKSDGPKREPIHRDRNTARASTVSVVIPAHNEEAYLKDTLTALRRQRYPCEIIVVANGCDDRTADVARDHCDRLVVLSQKSLGVARNLGAKIAGGELLIFLDADTLLERNALRVIVNHFQKTDAAGTVKGRPDTGRFAYQLIYGLKNFMHRAVLRNGSAGVIICWKKDFVGLGGFNEHLEVRENSELMKRLKRFGGYRYIGGTVATTSMRRYERRGVWRIVWLWTKLWVESLFNDLQHRKYEIVR